LAALRRVTPWVWVICERYQHRQRTRVAYRQQKKPAQAIAGLTSALWLKGGLGEADAPRGPARLASAAYRPPLSQGRAFA